MFALSRGIARDTDSDRRSAAYVFVENGDHFDRRPVHVKYRDQYSAVLANDGSIFPGEAIALNSAAFNATRMIGPAIAGATNFILKKDFNGIELNAQYGISAEDDTEVNAFEILLGSDFVDGKGNATFWATYNDRERLGKGDRLGSHDVRERAAEHHRAAAVDRRRVLLRGQDHAAARTSQ